MSEDLRMREELQKVLNRCRERFVQELDVSVTFLGKLVDRGIIHEEHKRMIESKYSLHSKADELIRILKRRDNSILEKFYSVLLEENSDLAEYFLEQKACIEPLKNRNVCQNYDEIDLKNCQTSDIIEGFKEVQRKGSDLEEYIDPENGLLHRLSNQMILDYTDIKNLEKIKPYQSLNGELLGRISINIDSISKQFIEALCQDEQVHIAKFIVTAGCETNSDERLLPRELRKVIDDNMFFLEKLIDTEKHDLVHKLFRKKCITSRHRDRVIHSNQEDKAHELLIILRRRRYKDYFNFMECLRKSMQQSIVEILKRGGIVEMKIQRLQERSDRGDIEAELIKKLTGYVDEDNASCITEDQRKFVDELLAELAENDIYFIGPCTVTSNGSNSMFLQSEQDDSFSESGSLKPSQNRLPGSLVIVEFSKLVIDKLIGSGGYGRVYKALHPDFPGTVAYKRINAVFVQPWEEANLKDEAKIHMQLDHPNIVKCFAVVFESENYGMILEFMKHGAAKNFLMNNNNLRLKLKIINDVAAGMKYLHSIKPHAVIHGDLKLENVLISEDEIAKVCDFGFSRWKEYSKSHSVETVPLGTVTHVPPERWRKSTVRKEEKFDVYSFGITMWEILTLKLPFAGEHMSSLIQSWVEDNQRPNLGDIPKNVAENVVNLMVECWDGDKTRRPSFEDILTRLEMEL